jgi:multiple sugar transport system substrate-binding protein
MKRLFRILSVLTIGTFVLAACATPATAPPATPQVIVQTQLVTQVVNQTQVVKETQIVQSTVVVAPTSPPELVKGEVRVGSWDSGPALAPFTNAIASFQAKYPNVKITLESVPQGYGDKLLTQFAAGTAPDVFQVGDGDVSKFAGQGVLEPLDPYIKGANPLDMGVFFPAVADIGKVGGQTYLLTKDYSPLVLYYNKAEFDAAKVTYPNDKWSWNDLLAAAQKLTVPGKQWGLQLPDSWGDPLWLRGISPLIYQNGGSLISDDGKTTTGHMNSKETVAALQFYVDLFSKYKVSPTKDDVASLSGQDLFQTGKVAMLWTGRWPLQDFQKNAKLNFGTTSLPAGPSGTHANSICWAGFAVYSKGTNKDAAWAFVKYIAAEQGAQEFAKYAFTDVKAIADLQGLSTDPLNAPIIKDLANVKPLPEFKNAKFTDCAEKFFKEQLELVLLKGKDLQAAMDEAAASADKCMAAS